MKKLFLFLPLVGIIFLYGCGNKTTTPVAQTTTATPAVDCKSDMNCLQRNFITCAPATFTMPFMAGSNLNIEVVGETDQICDYKAMVVDSTQSSSMGSECKLPMALMTPDRVGHLFGAEKVPGKEALAQTQQEIDAQYCTQL